MKLLVLQENLSKAIAIAARFTNTKAQLPILANILFSTKKNKLRLFSTNLENSVFLTIGAKVEKDGELAVPARIISDLITNLSRGQINLESEKEKLKISADNFKSSIAGMNAADFPPVPQKLGKDLVVLPKEAFIEALSQVIFAVSIDETRPVLTGVLVVIEKEQLILVSTDGVRLSQKKIRLPSSSSRNKGRVIIPKGVLAELLRLSKEADEVSFSVSKDESQILFGVGEGMVLASRIIEGEFPNFERIIPKSSNLKIRVDKEELVRAVKLASVFARESANVIKIVVYNKFLEIIAESSNSGNQRVEVDAQIEGSSTSKSKKNILEIAFNYRFLEEFLSVVKSDEVVFQFSDANSPGVFSDPKNPDFLHLVMPVNV